MKVRDLIKELLECDMNHDVYVELLDHVSYRQIESVDKPYAFSSSTIVALKLKETR